MRIGTDVSLKECKKEGYLMMDFKVRDLYPNGRKNGIDKDAIVRFLRHYPDYMLEKIYGIANPVGEPTLVDDVYYSASDLWTIYLKDMESIDKMSSFEVGERPYPENEYDMLTLADDISGYKVL